MSRILVTGQSGFIGSHVCDMLLTMGHEVYGISRTKGNTPEGVTYFECDLTDREKTAKIVSEVKCEYVFMLAANAAEGKSVFSPIEITTSGINTFLNVLVPAINTGHLKKFNFTSSIAVYGPITIPYREQDLPLPQDMYGIAKLSIEQMIRVMGSVHGFKYTITRPHNVFGPRQNMRDPYRNVVTLFMNHLLKGEPYTIYGDGSMQRAFSFVEDVVKVIVASGMDSLTGLTLNVGSDTPRTLKELSEGVQEVSGVNVEPKYLPSRVHEVHSAVSDHTVSRALYGYGDTPFKEALAETWAWCLTQGPAEYEFNKLEIDHESIPRNWK